MKKFKRHPNYFDENLYNNFQNYCREIFRPENIICYSKLSGCFVCFTKVKILNFGTTNLFTNFRPNVTNKTELVGYDFEIQFHDINRIELFRNGCELMKSLNILTHGTKRL
jgi:hypothetical protein